MNKVFIVDDDDSILKLYEKFLDFKGFEVLGHAKNGIEAVNKFFSFKSKPDLIIMDYHMPYKNGIEAMKEILKIDKNVKILLISGDCSIRNEALAAGAICFKKKPFSLQELYSLISIHTYKKINLCRSEIQF